MTCAHIYAHSKARVSRALHVTGQRTEQRNPADPRETDVWQQHFLLVLIEAMQAESPLLRILIH